MIAALNKLAQRLTARPPARRESVQKVDTAADAFLIGFEDTYQFIAMRYQGMTGWCNVGWCVGEPSAATFTCPTWFFVDSSESLRIIARQVVSLAQRHGDAYVSRTLHSTQERTKATALPSTWVFADDAPRDVPVHFTHYISTGTGDGHGWYCLPEPITTDENERISQAIAIHLQADSGFSITKMVRVPGTINTKAKHGGNYTVCTDGAHSSGEIVTLAQLRAAYPESVIDVRATLTTELNRQHIEVVLGNIKQLLDEDGLPARVKVHNPGKVSGQIIASVNQTRENFRQWKNGDFYNDKSGVQRDDTTGCRFTAAKALAYYYVECEAAALLLHFIPETRRRGEQWLWNDVASCISKGIESRKASYAARNQADWQPQPAFNPTKSIRKPERIHAEPAPAHRPAELTTERVFRFYQEIAQADCVEMTRAQRATHLNISAAALYRFDKILEHYGLIECYQIGRHGARVVVLADTFKGIQKSNQGYSEVPQNEVVNTLKSASQREKTKTNTIMGTHVLPANPGSAIGGVAAIQNEYPCLPEPEPQTPVETHNPQPAAVPTAGPSLAMAVEFVPLDLLAASAAWDGGTLRRWCESGGLDFDRVMRLVVAYQTMPARAMSSITTQDSFITIHAGSSDTTQPQPAQPAAVSTARPSAQPAAVPIPNKSHDEESRPAPPPARPLPIYGPNAAALAILMETPGYLEFVQDCAARPPIILPRPFAPLRQIPKIPPPEPNPATQPAPAQPTPFVLTNDWQLWPSGVGLESGSFEMNADSTMVRRKPYISNT